jgi:hypothetical protein
VKRPTAIARDKPANPVASGSRTRSHAFAHGTSRPSRVGRRRPPHSRGDLGNGEKDSEFLSSFLLAILAVRQHWLPMTACKRAILIPDIADAPIGIREGCRLFPSVGDSADGGQGAVLYSYVGAACAIGSLWRRLGMGGLQKHRAGNQER